MTIIEPNRTRQGINIWYYMSISLLIIAAMWSIWVYNETVQLRYDLKKNERKIGVLQEENAALKNERYAMTSTNALRAVLLARGLVKIEKPVFLNLNAYNEEFAVR